MKWLRIFCIFLALIIITLATSCASQSYTRLENFNGQFSIDYPRGWQFNPEISDNKTVAAFTGTINGKKASVIVYSEEIKDFGLGLVLDYKNWVNTFLDSEEWSDKLVFQDMILGNGAKITCFGRGGSIVLQYFFICDLDTQTLFTLATIGNSSDSDRDSLIEYCKHMINSVTVENKAITIH